LPTHKPKIRSFKNCLKNLKDTDVDHKREKSANELSSNTLGGAEGQIGKSGLSRSNDFVDDIPLGEVTHLNTQEFKYYGFYNRIKQQLEQFWGKSISEKARSLYRSGRRLPGNEQLITSVTVILNEKGDILNILIDGSSGVKELDQAAVESFKKAGPFPNPPKGLVVNGRAVIQWGFVVKS
jgi:TonB family protein